MTEPHIVVRRVNRVIGCAEALLKRIQKARPGLEQSFAKGKENEKVMVNETDTGNRLRMPGFCITSGSGPGAGYGIGLQWCRGFRVRHSINAGSGSKTSRFAE